MKTTTQSKSLLKLVLAFAAALLLAAGGTGVATASSPVLYNGDLNQVTAVDTPGSPPVGWTALGVQTVQFPSGGWTDCEASEPWCNGIADPDPVNGYGMFIKAFEGATNANPLLDNLCGMYFYQDNPSSPNTTYTLSAYVGAGGTYSGYSTNVLNYNAGTATYVAPITALFVAFYNSSGGIIQSNAYDLVANGLQTTGNLGGGAQPTQIYTTPVYTAPAGTTIVRAGLLMLYQWGGTAQPSLFADDFDLEGTAPPGSPVVTTQPTGQTAGLGGTAHFTVGTTPTATTNAWLFNGATVNDVAGHISGSTTATLTITGVTTGDVGHYQAIVSNASGLNRSAVVPLAISTAYIFPAVSVNGTVGDTYQIYSSLTVGGPYTNLVTTVKLSSSPQYIIDSTVPVNTAKFYKAVYIP